MVYFLILTDIELSYDNFTEDFLIGVFETEEKAVEIAKHYLKNVKGFSDYNCTYRVEKKEIFENTSTQNPENIWFVQGWNVNENFDEVDIVESACFITKERASKEMRNMKRKYERSEWCVDNYRLNELHCKEGFVRVLE